MERICAATRVENWAAAAQLVAIGELFAYRLARCSQDEDRAIDTMAAVAAEVGCTGPAPPEDEDDPPPF